MIDFRTRPATADDLRLVASSWFESYWKATALKTGMEFGVYKAGQGDRVRRLLDRGVVTVAFFESAPDEILGYVVGQKDVCHFCYVKKDYRHQLIATRLLAGYHTFTHHTPAGANLALGLGMKFNPYHLDAP